MSWQQEYARRMRRWAMRDSAERLQTFSTGGRRTGKTKAMQEEVDRARATGQTVAVVALKNGVSCREIVPGIWIEQRPSSSRPENWLKPKPPLTIQLQRDQYSIE